MEVQWSRCGMKSLLTFEIEANNMSPTYQYSLFVFGQCWHAI